MLKTQKSDPRFKDGEEFFVADRIVDDLTFSASLYEVQRAEKSEMVGNGALILPEHEAEIGHAHFSDTKRGKDPDAGSVRKDGKEIGEIGGNLVFGQIIADDVLVVR